MTDDAAGAAGALSSREIFVPNDDGWLLHLRRIVNPERLDPSRPPVLIVPGYGMNAFIFGFHPRGTSLARALADSGLEVWTVDLRAQGPSRPSGSTPSEPSLRAYADVDVRAATDAVLERTASTRGRVTLLGASLGGSIAYAHVALRPDHKVAGVIAIGSPLRWTRVHPLLALAFRSPRLAGSITVRGVRRLAETAVPAISRVPGILAPYMNTAHVDLTALPQLVRTIEDPHPRVNQDIAEWIRQRDLILRGVHVTRGLGNVDVPLLVVIANRDGIVPDEPALAAVDAWGGSRVDVLRVGDQDRWYAHADLFVGDYAPEDVFAPLNDWLRSQDL